MSGTMPHDAEAGVPVEKKPDIGETRIVSGGELRAGTGTHG